jgi:hypothetical protein
MKQTLFAGGADSVTNSIVHNALSGTGREEVQLVAADVFAERVSMTRPDIIKIDTEGCELPIITAISESFRTARAIFLEFHSEEDRLAIDRAFSETHILFSGKIPHPHRGELAYVRNDAFATPADRDRWRIGIKK